VQKNTTSVGTAGSRKRVAPEFSTFHFFHFSLYQDGTKWVCTTRDVPGTKTVSMPSSFGHCRTQPAALNALRAPSSFHRYERPSLVDKPMGVVPVTRIPETLSKIKPTEPLTFTKRVTHQKRNFSDSWGHSQPYCTKTSGRNGKMWKVENSGATRFLQPAVYWSDQVASTPGLPK
jgi:hypothetical protein